MAEKTNNSKVITKDYLAEQFFIYHNKYIKEGIESNKQDKLIVDTKHLTWDNSNLGLRIDNDNSAQENDYISLKNSDGTLTWKTPITNQSEIVDNNENLVTGTAVFNFEGSNNIKKVGTISEGSWDVGDIQIDDNSLQISDFTIKQEESGELSILSEGQNGLIADSLSLNKNLTVTDDISAKNITITSDLKIIEGEADIAEAIIGDCKVYNLKIVDTISTVEGDSDINFANNISVDGDVKLKNIDFTGTSFSIISNNIECLKIKENNIDLNKDITAKNNITISKNSTVNGKSTTKDLEITENKFILGGEELIIATDTEINSFFEDWQS